MSSRGVNYLKMVFANAASFELGQEISKDGNTFTFSGMRKFWHFIAYSILEHKFIYTKSIRFELCKSIIHEMTIINNILFAYISLFKNWPKCHGVRIFFTKH